MPLFTDGPISSIEEMAARDSQLLSVASVEGVDVTQKIGLAQDEIEVEISTLLAGTHTAGTFWMDSYLSAQGVVVTPALKSWHTLRALELVYSDAYNSQLNDRYGGKRDQFHKLASRAYESLLDTGIGIAAHPLPKAGAPFVSLSAGLPLPDGTYYVVTEWTNAQGEESAASVPATVATSGSTLTVRPGPPPLTATGWNVFVGTSEDNLCLQNGTPIGTGDAWLQPGALLTGGRAPGSGQPPTYFKTVPRMIQRG